MSDVVEPSRKPITESPWYWFYLFATTGLIFLVVMSPKFASRQAQVERQNQGRNRAIQQQIGQTPTTEMSTSDKTLVTLRPLFWILGGVLVVAWALLWWSHFRQPRTATQPNNGGTVT